MKAPFQMHEVHLKGGPRERGQQHGEALRSQIRALWGLDEESLKRLPGGLDGYLRTIVDHTGLLAAARRWVPELLEEIEGVAEGAALDFRTAFAVQLVDERDWVWEQAAGPNRCSSLGAFDEGRTTILAQNVDGGVTADGFMTLLHHHDPHTGWEAHTITYPGVIGIWGLNKCGVGVCLNAMGALMNRSHRGLGTILVARGILGQVSLADAVRFVTTLPHATGENYLIGEAGCVVDYEASANKVTRFEPWAGATRVFHTNHPIVNDDVLLTPDIVAGFAPDRQERYRLAMANTRARLDALERRLSDMSRPVTTEAAREALCSHDSPEHPVCRHRIAGQEAMTNACLIMELGANPALHVSSGPPCQSEFRTLRFGG